MTIEFRMVQLDDIHVIHSNGTTHRMTTHRYVLQVRSIEGWQSVPVVHTDSLSVEELNEIEEALR